MKKMLTIIIICFAIQANAQIHADGTVITSFSATDISGTVLFSSSTTTANGKHFLIDFSATWCTNCWFYHGTKVLDNYYQQYGPNGALTQDAEVLFYEGDYSTNMNDMNGIGTNTVGDWVTGSNYLLFNEATPSNVISSFTGNGQIGFPTVFVVCSDNKMYRLSTSIVDAAQVRTFVDQKCGINPLSAKSISTMNFEYDVFPNPSTENVNIKLAIQKPVQVAISLYNAVGQLVMSEERFINVGGSLIQLYTKELSKGMYILNMTLGNEKIHHLILRN